MENQDHPLKLYNSLTRQVEPFVPQDASRVTMYNCGPTVYSYAHIGNARAAVVADVLFRVLRHIYGEDAVEYARNITDVDDRIIAAATEQGVPISEITEKYAKVYQDDLAALNCLPPTQEPKATEHIGGMIDLIETLLADGYAYATDGHVFFDVSKYEDYGKLSGNTLENLRKGDRVGEGEVARKKNAADFVLWKPELNGVGWDAPFGRGRPGWHIECSAMAKAELDETIDIHCGGIDLKFPHHENEIAQSNCAHGKPMANYWVHNEFLQMGKDKMSKSLGNVVLVHDLLKEWDGEVIRLALLKAHYRSELVWSEALLRESKAQLDRMYRAWLELQKGIWPPDEVFSEVLPDELCDDLQVPNLLARFSDQRSFAKTMHEGYQDVTDADEKSLATSKAKISTVTADAVFTFIDNLRYLGLLQRDPEEWFRGNASEDEEQLLADYQDARQKALQAKASGDKVGMGKAFAASDAIREELKERGFVIETAPDGTSKLRRD